MLRSNFPILGYDIGEKVCHPRRMLEKIHFVISFCCRCIPACPNSKWLTRYIFNPIRYCVSMVKGIIWTIIVCALDYSDLTKDLGFIVALEYISDAIIVSSTYVFCKSTSTYSTVPTKRTAKPKLNVLFFVLCRNYKLIDLCYI